eukprot:GHVQ01028836.1.p1 GENE.GHVQ01028836.1~~GHVQ01028836.1.p1  ORF type:complete len:237 (-),score=44.18 GHVQ01028836.1:179-889(-)
MLLYRKMDLWKARRSVKCILMSIHKGINKWNRSIKLQTANISKFANLWISMLYVYDTSSVKPYLPNDNIMNYIRTEHTRRLLEARELLHKQIVTLREASTIVSSSRTQLQKIIEGLQQHNHLCRTGGRGGVHRGGGGGGGRGGAVVVRGGASDEEGDDVVDLDKSVIYKHLTWSGLCCRVATVDVGYIREVELREKLMDTLIFLPLNDRSELERFIALWTDDQAEELDEFISLEMI